MYGSPFARKLFTEVFSIYFLFQVVLSLNDDGIVVFQIFFLNFWLNKF